MLQISNCTNLRTRLLSLESGELAEERLLYGLLYTREQVKRQYQELAVMAFCRTTFGSRKARDDALGPWSPEIKMKTTETVMVKLLLLYVQLVNSFGLHSIHKAVILQIAVCMEKM